MTYHCFGPLLDAEDTINSFIDQARRCQIGQDIGNDIGLLLASTSFDYLVEFAHFDVGDDQPEDDGNNKHYGEGPLGEALV